MAPFGVALITVHNHNSRMTNERILNNAISAAREWAVANPTQKLGANGEPMNYIILEAISRALTHAKQYLRESGRL